MKKACKAIAAAPSSPPPTAATDNAASDSAEGLRGELRDLLEVIPLTSSPLVSIAGNREVGDRSVGGFYN